jgi:hypothetical protein
VPTKIGIEQCQLLVHAKSRTGSAAAAVVAGAYGPSDLQSAYNLASAVAGKAAGTTVAIVDAYSDPNLVSDLATYRSNYGQAACDATTGAGCLTVLNETGGSPSAVPADPTGGWEGEQALDVEMVSAICPNCRIVMYEANSSSTVDLGTAENTAAGAGYKFISNSWSGFDYPGESYYDTQYFNHPGVVTAFASGDFGYGAGYPASSGLVTSVGGTYLATASNTRGWTETVWNDANGATGSGCSSGEGKPAWQTDSGCANRTENDVAAVADGPSGISIYDSYNSSGNGLFCGASWCAVGGTSVATPIITSAYALAGTPAANTYPSQYLYENASSTGFNRVTSGTNGTCEASRSYLCSATSSLSSGYNGPTGWGTPNGVAAFTNTATANIVSVVNPGAYDLQAGLTYGLPAIKAYDSASGQTLTYSASGLPSGLTINTATGAISGNPVAANSTVKVTVTDGTSSSTITFPIVAVASLRTAYHAGSGAVHLDLGGKCMDDSGNSTANGTKIQIWTCNGGAGQSWAYYPDTDPGDAGTLVHNGKCLDVTNGGTANGTKLDLYSCNGSGSQQWYVVGSAGELYNPQSGKCAEDPYSSTANGRQLDIWTCNLGVNQAWTLPASPVVSGVSGKCLDDAGNSSANGNPINSYACNGLASQKWTIGLDGSLRINGKCLDAAGRGTTDGTLVQLYACNSDINTNANQLWYVTGTGVIENVNAEKCLAIPGNSTANGTRLALEDCTGQPGEVWAVS